jgi:RimJ/RimL family protein N-acetyltransferase
MRLLDPTGGVARDVRAYVCEDDQDIIGFACLTLPSQEEGDSRRVCRLELSLRSGPLDTPWSDLLLAVHADAPEFSAIHAETAAHAELLEAHGYHVAKVNVHLAVELGDWKFRPLGLPYQFLPYTDIESDTDKLSELHALITRTLEDVPRAVPRRSWSFEEFLAHRRTNSDLLPALSVVASDNGRLVAFTELKKTGEPGTLLSSLTGVHPDYRGRHLSFEVKRHALSAAKHAGFRRVVTQNARTNDAMIRANQRLGFTPTHRTYECVLTQERRHG